MNITRSLLPLFLAGSIAAAQQAPTKAVYPAKAQAHAPLAIPEKTTPPAGEAKSAAASSTKISKEQAGTIAMGEWKNSQVVSSTLKEVEGKSVWAVTLKSGKDTHHVNVDANAGSIVRGEKAGEAGGTTTTKHETHKKTPKEGSKN